MEKTIGVSEARQNLMKLTRHVADNMDRLVLTNKGRAETVLLSFEEYRSLKAAAQLAMHPEILKAAREGFEEIKAGKGLTLEEAFGNVVEAESGYSPLVMFKQSAEPKRQARRPSENAGAFRKAAKTRVAIKARTRS